MKKQSTLTSLIILIALLSVSRSSHAQTAFTYQGQLRDGSTNANGTYSLTFKLFDAVASGSQIGSTLSAANQSIVNGLFTVNLDFGSAAFDGNARWLEITVQSTNVLAPRVAVLPAPYALFATKAGSVMNGAIQNPSFLGTTGNTPLSLFANNEAVLRLQPNGTNSPNIIAGYSGNTVSNGFVGATIAGGGAGIVPEAGDGLPSPNIVGANYATVGGGVRNKATGVASTVAGGFGNTARGDVAMVAGGNHNTASGDGAMVASGSQNTASGDSAFVGGGQSNLVSGASAAAVGGSGNVASGTYAFVGGGANNVASGISAIALGNSAQATHDKSFIWSSGSLLSSTAQGEFAARGDGGFRFLCVGSSLTITDGAVRLNNASLNVDRSTTFGNNVTINNGFLSVPNGGASFSGRVSALAYDTTSDRNAKQDFAPVNPREVLARVTELPIQTWTFKQDTGTRHLGPMAQDFFAAFRLGTDDKHIATVDADGVALAAIQGLHSLVKDKDAEIADLKKRLETLERIVLKQNGGGQ